MFKKGFTLAEVLITLTIIGIVASMTIPSLINNIGDQQNKIAWKKTYADLSQATMRIIADNGGSLKGLCISHEDNCFSNYYQRYFNYLKACNSATAEGCWHDANNWKALDGTFRTAVNAQPGIILNNGTLILLAYNDSTCNYGSMLRCADFWIDINGFKGPNMVGKDIFYAYAKENMLISGGSQYDTLGCEGSTGTNSGTGCSAQYLYQ